MTNALIFGVFAFFVPTALMSAIMLADVLLLMGAAAGVVCNCAPLLVPNIAAKITLLLLLVFIGCSSITKVLHAYYIKEAAAIVNDSMVARRPAAVPTDSLMRNPSLLLFAVPLELLVAIEIRLFLGMFREKSSCGGSGNNDEILEVEKNPPSYAYCMSNSFSRTSTMDELPSYEEAVAGEDHLIHCYSVEALPRASAAEPEISVTSYPGVHATGVLANPSGVLTTAM